MKIKDMRRYQRVMALFQAGKINRAEAQKRLAGGAMEAAIENSDCIACWKWNRCIVRKPTTYTIKEGKNKGRCTWFDAVPV